MKPIVVVRPEAESELRAALGWYERCRAGLGREFLDSANRAVAQIIARPRSFPCVRGVIRRANLDRFPYGVFFRANDQEIVILGVIHGQRDPTRWP